jgi:type I restriction enzyme S subunit
MSSLGFSAVPLASACRLITDGSHFSPTPQEEGYPIVNAKDIPNGSVVLDTCTRISERDYHLLKLQNCAPIPGDVLLSKDGTIGRVVHYKEDLGVVLLSSVAILRPDPTVIAPAFLAQTLGSHCFDQQLFRLQSGSALKRLVLGDIRKIKVPLPKLHIQTEIAKILSSVDEAIKQTETLIVKYQLIKAGLMHDLFTRGVTPDGNLRPTCAEAPHLYKDSLPGWIPKGWSNELLDGLAQRGSGHTPNKNCPEYWNGGVKWISLADSWRLDSVYISDTDNQISQRGIESSSAVLHPPGIVVLSRDAGVGKSAITTCSMAVSQHFMCWRCGPQLDNHYLYYWLQYRKRDFENIATGSTIPTIGLRFFRRYRINVPTDVEEQKHIGAALLSVDRTIWPLEANVAKLRQQKEGLMHDLLTGRVRVETQGIGSRSAV